MNNLSIPTNSKRSKAHWTYLHDVFSLPIQLLSQSVTGREIETQKCAICNVRNGSYECFLPKCWMCRAECTLIKCIWAIMISYEWVYLYEHWHLQSYCNKPKENKRKCWFLGNTHPAFAVFLSQNADILMTLTKLATWWAMLIGNNSSSVWEQNLLPWTLKCICLDFGFVPFCFNCCCQYCPKTNYCITKNNNRITIKLT